MILTPEQTVVHDAAVAFVGSPRDPYLTIGGFAGTGKTTVTAEIVRTLRKANEGIVIAFCCFTGKAASVLRTKLEAAGALEAEEHCGTIHSLIYEPILRDEKIVGWRRVGMIDADLLIVDEASMVNQTLWDDLMSYGVPALAIGDHGQLPPIEGAFNLMQNPHHRLVKIHRQAEDNPIIKLSMVVRETGDIAYGVHGPGVWKTAGPNEDVLNRVKDLRGTLFLCGLNRTRKSVNKAVRERLGYKGDNPQAGEKVICLRNNREIQIYNGVNGTLRRYKPLDREWAEADIDMENGVSYSGAVFRPQFGAERTIQEWPDMKQKDLYDLFDWGYCLTVHKAQGSEAEHVVVFEERFSRMDDDQWRRWLYTAVTRARRSLMIVNRRFDTARVKPAGVLPSAGSEAKGVTP